MKEGRKEGNKKKKEKERKGERERERERNKSNLGYQLIQLWASYCRKTDCVRA